VYLSNASGMVSVDSSTTVSAQSETKSTLANVELKRKTRSHFVLSPFNKYAGYLLRVKPSTSDEGGVAAGYSFLSSPSLVDEDGVASVDNESSASEKSFE